MLDPRYTIWLTLFAIITYLIVVDQNLLKYIYVIFKLCKVNITKFIWMVRFHPNNPITNFMMNMKYSKLAKQLEKDLSEKG